jgi:hypothetical protein
VAFGALLVNAPLAFADLKAVVTIECDPASDQVVHAQASSGSPVTSLPSSNKCTDALIFLDANHFKVMDTLRTVSATTINEVPGSTAGTTPAFHSNYLYVFVLD